MIRQTDSRTFVALSRRDYIVRRHALSPAQHDLLAAILAGRPVGEAIQRAAEADDNVEALSENLNNWFHQWSAAGFFQSVELPG